MHHVDLDTRSEDGSGGTRHSTNREEHERQWVPTTIRTFAVGLQKQQWISFLPSKVCTDTSLGAEMGPGEKDGNGKRPALVQYQIHPPRRFVNSLRGRNARTVPPCEWRLERKRTGTLQERSPSHRAGTFYNLVVKTRSS